MLARLGVFDGEVQRRLADADEFAGLERRTALPETLERSRDVIAADDSVIGDRNIVQIDRP